VGWSYSVQTCQHEPTGEKSALGGLQHWSHEFHIGLFAMHSCLRETLRWPLFTSGVWRGLCSGMRDY